MSDEGGAGLSQSWIAARFANLDHKTPAKWCFSSRRPEGPDERQLGEMEGATQVRPRSSENATADQTPTEEPEERL